MSITAAIICAVVYAVINWLDPYTLSWQCLNRPIVVAPLVGLLLGDFQTGIIMGASLEAIFMGISAVGGSIPTAWAAASSACPAPSSLWRIPSWWAATVPWKPVWLCP